MQIKAAEKALQSNSVSLIHGPPGTGKTRTLIAIIRKLVSEGNRVLACAHSNQAVDNLIIGSSSLRNTDENSLHYDSLHDNLKISRVGNGIRNNLVKANYSDVNASSADVVATTMNNAEKFDIDSFDVAIVDEASQASIASTIIPFNAAKKTILAGDHKQLPPYSTNEFGEGKMMMYLFEHFLNIYGDDISTMLNIQYRMNDKIATFPSQSFYDNKLQSAEQNYDWTFGGLSPIIAYDNNTYEEQTTGKSYKNTGESKIIANQVDSLLNYGAKEKDIGIITAYSGQIESIENELDNIEHSTKNIKVNTIDSFQGSEKEIILVSFVRSNEQGRTGFLSIPNEGKRRLNVAMTRAKKRLVLVGNWSTLTSKQDNREDCSQIYRDLYNWLNSNSKIKNQNKQCI